jgi:hypothetical protein
MKKQIPPLALILFLILSQGYSFVGSGKEHTAHVIIRVFEEGASQTTPVMVCITGVNDGQARVPPFALIPTTLSSTAWLYTTGVVDYKPTKSWVGPIRRMNGTSGYKDGGYERSTAYGLLPSIPHWREPVIYQTSGDFTIDLPPGEWRISLEHGNEFIPIKEEFVISKKEKELTKTFFLKRWIDLPSRGWWSGDVHVHHPTTKPEFKQFLFEYAKAENVHLVNLLEQGDDHRITGSKQEGFGEQFRLCKENICLVAGQEDPSSRFGHIIGLNIRKMERDTATYNYYDLVFKKLHQQPGALVGFAHFSWNGCDLPRGFPWLITTKEIDFVELLALSRINTLDYYDYLNLGFRLTAGAGSDFPWGSTIGDVRTFVYTGKGFSADAWFEGLKAGHTFVTNGPALFLDVDGQLPGTEIMKNRGSVSALKVKALSHPGIGIINRIAIYNNDGLVVEKLNPQKLDSLDIKITHTLDRSQWLAAVVYCENGAVAHTTPVYFIVDGQPTWDTERAADIIQKQMDAIQKVEGEEKANKKVDAGILTRLDAAREFYRNLLLAIQSSDR